MTKSADRYEKALAKATLAGRNLAALNAKLIQMERGLTDPAGLPRRPWFQHTIYAPGFYTGYGVKTMPGIREALEQNNVGEARAQSGHVAQAIERMAARADKAAHDLLALKP